MTRFPVHAGSPTGFVLGSVPFVVVLFGAAETPGVKLADDRVAGARARKDAVGQPDAGIGRRDKTAHVGHEHDQRHLPHKHALAGHVGAGEDEHALAVMVEPRIVGDKAFAFGQAVYSGDCA